MTQESPPPDAKSVALFPSMNTSREAAAEAYLSELLLIKTP